MNNVIEEIRNMLITLMSVTMAYFAPINNMVFVIFFIFAINCIAGMVAGIVSKKERFSIKKFFHCLLETLVFYLIVLCVFVVGEKMNNVNGALQCITGLVYAICYFYGVNILRNTRKLFPKSKVLNFIYYVVSLEMVKKIPYLQEFMDKEKNEKRKK